MTPRVFALALAVSALLGCKGPPPAAAPQALLASPPPGPTRAECCQRCVELANRDPAGMDLSVQPCARYRGSFHGNPGLSDACAQRLERVTVGACQREAPPAP